MTAPPAATLRMVNVRRAVVLPNRQVLNLLSDVSITIWPGESIAIQGRSGSGKTTLLSLMGLLTRPDGGRIYLNGADAGELPDSARARLRNRDLGFVFQNYSLVAHLNAGQNVELGLRYSPRRARRKMRVLIAEALELVGLAGRARSMPQHLSGGEQQRVGLARALVGNPRLVLADEPTGALDVETGALMIDLMINAVRHRSAALVVVTHDEAVSARMARRMVLDRGLLRDASDGAMQ